MRPEEALVKAGVESVFGVCPVASCDRDALFALMVRNAHRAHNSPGVYLGIMAGALFADGLHVPEDSPDYLRTALARNHLLMAGALAQSRLVSDVIYGIGIGCAAPGIVTPDNSSRKMVAVLEES
jgi:hypothetical protein